MFFGHIKKVCSMTEKLPKKNQLGIISNDRRPHKDDSDKNIPHKTYDLEVSPLMLKASLPTCVGANMTDQVCGLKAVRCEVGLAACLITTFPLH